MVQGDLVVRGGGSAHDITARDARGQVSSQY